ncbi:hypothetical protein EG329_003247 [Mollisiaceae sp. DMI_Dod_QoI]|nr:hypothetical protein EG329_003247 [Helotiales sp. DMI_Dod_QoI]
MKYLSPRSFTILAILIIVSWFLFRSYQYAKAELLDFSRELAFEYSKLTKEHSVGECATVWTTPSLQGSSLESQQSELVRRLVRAHFGSKDKVPRTSNHAAASNITQSYMILSLQLGAMAISCVIAKQYQRASNADWDQLLEEYCPIWSSLPVLRYIWKRWFCRQQNFSFNKPLWRMFLQPVVTWFLVLSAVLFLLLLGPVKSALYLLQVLLSYEASSFLFTSVFGGTLSLLGGGTPRKLMQLRHKPGLAALMACQISLWFLCMDILPVTVTATLCIIFISGNEPEYLAQDYFEGIQRRKFKFCDICRSSVLPILSDLRPVDSMPHHWTSKGLQKAMKGGCRICSAVWQLRTSTPKDVWGILFFWKPVTTFTITSTYLDICQEENQKYKCHFELLEVESQEFEGASLFNYFEKRKLSDHTGSVESLQLASQWLKACTLEHKCLASRDVTYFRPTRLLYLGPVPEKLPRHPEEYDSSMLRIQTHSDYSSALNISYTTLSHCWGGQGYIKLLSNNISELCRQIQFSSLPTTFRHAIFITQVLGFEYLWIDSLCIVQDSSQDWGLEAGRMGDVYRHSQCNIAAPDAANSEIGCLYPRNPRTIEPELIEVQTHTGQDRRVLLNMTDIYGDHILYTRAWVLQEAMLAPRTLDCGKGQLFWRCGEVGASELFPRGVPPSVYCEDHPASGLGDSHVPKGLLKMNIRIIEEVLRREDTKGLLPRKPNEGSMTDVFPESFDVWRSVVEKFTSMNLSFASDRLVALAGIINVFHPFLGSNYAGLWRVFLPFELLWHVEEKSSRPDFDRAPTWSWQSVDCKVSYHKCRFDRRQDALFTRLLDIYPDFITSSGKPSIALRLQGPLLRITWTGWLPPEIKTYNTCQIKSVEGHTYPVTIRGFPMAHEPYGEISFDNSADPKPSEELFCLPIINNPKPYDFRSSRFRHKGLVLERIAGNSYRRIGFFQGLDEVGLTDIIKNMEQQEIVLV